MRKVLTNTTVILLLGVTAGIILGNFANEEIIKVIQPIKHISGQIIMFMVPLIILGFVTPSIARLKGNASKLLSLAVCLAYLSSVGAALFSIFVGYNIIPLLNIETAAEAGRSLPAMLFRIDIPPVMSVMTALTLAITGGLSVIWTKSEAFAKLLDEFQKMVLSIVNKILIPILPVFIASNFTILGYEGTLNSQFPVFFKVIFIVLAGHFVWLAILYTIAGIYSGKNPLRVLRHYGPAYLTAVGTMSSAASLGAALKSAKKSDILRNDVTDFSVPLFSNIHLCGSVLTEVFFVLTVSQIVYGTLPSVSSMILFVLLLAIFAIGAPGVPGGTVMASLGLIISVLGFSEAATALLLTIFALQDSFGTACNVTGDGALSLIMTTYANKKEIKENKINKELQPAA